MHLSGAKIKKVVLTSALVLAAAGWVYADSGGAADPGAKPVTVEEAVAALSQELRSPNRYALVVGAGQYGDDHFSNLSNCATDAQAIQKVLLNPQIGLFPSDHVTLLTKEQVTQQNVKDALDQLARRAGPSDLVLIFFSGHGATDEQGRAYWVMADTLSDNLGATALPESDVTERLSAIKTDRLLMLIDTCYTAVAPKTEPTQPQPEQQPVFPHLDGWGRVAITAEKGDLPGVVMTSTSSPRRYSAFVWQVLSAFMGDADADTDGILTVDELWAFVKERTPQAARDEGGHQQPQIKGQMGGRFLLAVNADALSARATRTRGRVEELRALMDEGWVAVPLFDQGRKVLESDEAQLDSIDRRYRKFFIDLADGKVKLEEVDALWGKIGPFDAPEPAPAAPAAQQAAPPDAATLLRVRKFREMYLDDTLTAEMFNAGQPLLKANRETLSPYDHVRSLLFNQIVERQLGVEEFEPALARFETPAQEAQRLRAERFAHLRTNGKAGDIYINSAGIEMIYIPAGEFTMGSPADEPGRRGSEETQHQVRITRPFLMSVTEVTQPQWKAVMGDNPSKYKVRAHPVEHVSWENAIEFCRKLSEREGPHYSLPTEAQWEYACRAGTNGAYAGTGRLDDMAWYRENSGGGPRDVKQRSPNAWGLFDMHGNVSEWCSDWHGDYPEGAVTDPAGPGSGVARVMRGGSAGEWQDRCRSAFRSYTGPDHKSSLTGVRLVMELPE